MDVVRLIDRHRHKFYEIISLKIADDRWIDSNPVTLERASSMINLVNYLPADSTHFNAVVCEHEAVYTPRQASESLLYGVVSEHLETFLARQEQRDRTVPKFVEREFRSFLECGIPAHGFLRVHCDECGRDRLVPFSCKGRGFCESCGARRMADTASHLVDRVFPEVPVRQWVLTLIGVKLR
jgi:hypothetical protein